MGRHELLTDIESKPQPGHLPSGRFPGAEECREYLLALFDSKDTGGDYVLEPATDLDMRGKNATPKASLEVIYDDA